MQTSSALKPSRYLVHIVCHDIGTADASGRVLSMAGSRRSAKEVMAEIHPETLRRTTSKVLEVRIWSSSLTLAHYIEVLKTGRHTIRTSAMLVSYLVFDLLTSSPTVGSLEPATASRFARV